MSPSIGLTAGGGGGKTRTCAAAFPGKLPSEATAATPAAAVLRKSRRLPLSGAISDGRGFGRGPPFCAPRVLESHRGGVDPVLRSPPLLHRYPLEAGAGPPAHT